MAGNECTSVTEKLAGASNAIVYKSSRIGDLRGTKCWKCERLPGGYPAGSTRYEQTLSDPSVHVETAGFPRVEIFIPVGLALNHALVVGVRTERYIVTETASSVPLLAKSIGPPWNPSD